MGFSIGGNATVINTVGGNVIVKVKESRVALDSKMANKIMAHMKTKRPEHLYPILQWMTPPS